MTRFAAYAAIEARTGPAMLLRLGLRRRMPSRGTDRRLIVVTPSVDETGRAAGSCVEGAAGERAPIEPTCNGRCRPSLSLYEGRCPAHGFRALIDSLAENDEARLSR